VTNRFTPLQAAQDEVTPEDPLKGTKTVLLEVARETIESIKSQKKKKWISDEIYAAIMQPPQPPQLIRLWVQRAAYSFRMNNWSRLIRSLTLGP